MLNPIPKPATTRAHDLRELLQLAWPMLIGQVAQLGTGVADTIMAGAEGPTDLAAVAIGFSIWLPVYIFSIGVLSSITARIARAFGANNEPSQATVLQQGFWLALALAALLFAMIPFGHHLLPLMHVDGAVQPQTRIYLQGMTMGIPAVMGFQVLRALSEGSGRSRPVMVIQIIALLANLPLNYIFIHGLFGAPRLGGAGCGWATGCVMWLQLLLLAALTRPRWRELLAHPILRGARGPQLKVLKELFLLGAPIGGAMFAETSIFSGAALLVGQLGATTLAAHQIALNYSAMMFMVPMSLGLALTVKIGHALGANEPSRARRFAGFGAITSVLFAVCSAIVMLVFPYQISSAYTADEAVRQLTVQILAYSASFQLFDGLQVTAVGSLRGYHDTRMTMAFTLIAYWAVGLPLGYVLGLTDLIAPAHGVLGLWTGLIGGLAVAAVLLNWRLVVISKRHLFSAVA
ncbi:MAG: multidrug resistance protein [Verrucomicrobiaceae bacterium]|nr:multidrug resistance protein [Verrucomicrobiaceae bacterium]